MILVEQLPVCPSVVSPCFICVQSLRQAINMARGQQKIQSQQKNKEKMEKMKKAQSHDQKKAAQAGLKYVCASCKSQMPDPKTYKQHFENKHPKLDLPAELKEI